MSFKIVPVMIIAPIVNWKVNVASGNRNLEFLVWFNTTIFEQKKKNRRGIWQNMCFGGNNYRLIQFFERKYFVACGF